MYHYTDEQLESMKKVEASRASRIEKLHARMTADEKDAVLAQFHPDYITTAYEELKVGKNKGGKVLHELANLLQGHSRVKDMKIDLTKIDLLYRIACTHKHAVKADARRLAVSNGEIRTFRLTGTHNVVYARREGLLAAVRGNRTARIESVEVRKADGGIVVGEDLNLVAALEYYGIS